MQTVDNPITKRRYASCKCEPFSFSTKVTGLKKHLAKRGMSDVNLMTGWEKIVGYGLAKYSFPDWIKNISGVKTLCIKVLETRILECHHLKFKFLRFCKHSFFSILLFWMELHSSIPKTWRFGNFNSGQFS